MTDNSGQAAPGWYPDPSGAPRQRYFDGEVWTEHYHDAGGAAPGMPGAAMGGAAAMAGGVAQAALSPVDYVKKVLLENYANFNGRARRAEYWWWTLAVVIGYIIVTILAGILGDAGLILVAIFYLGILIPGLAVAIRRLHDTNRSGWWLLISLIPLIGSIILLVFMVSDSDRGPNQYGPSPKY